MSITRFQPFRRALLPSPLKDAIIGTGFKLQRREMTMKPTSKWEILGELVEKLSKRQITTV